MTSEDDGGSEVILHSPAASSAPSSGSPAPYPQCPASLAETRKPLRSGQGHVTPDLPAAAEATAPLLTATHTHMHIN